MQADLLESDLVAPKDEVELVRLGWLKLRILTGCCRDPIEEVEVLVDGKAVIVTSADGSCAIPVRVGVRVIKLLHHALGQDGHTVNVDVFPDMQDEHVVLADPNVFVYATNYPETDDGAEPAADPSIVWLCSDSAQIPEDAMPVCGQIAASAHDGSELMQALNAAPALALNLQFGATVGGTMTTAKTPSDYCSCTFGSVHLSCQRSGFAWRSKDPSPITERLAEFGGCEYLRLLQCPVAMGFRSPTFTVRGPDDLLLELPVDLCDTGTALKAECSRLTGIPSDLVLLQRAGVDLLESDLVVPKDEVQLMRLGWLKLRILAGCCREPLEGVEVLVDGKAVIMTSADGSCAVPVIVGVRAIKLSHRALGQDGHTLNLDVSPDMQDEHLVLADPQVFVYATDQDVEEGAEPAADPSIVWLCSDSAQIPEGALPVCGQIVASANDESEST